MMSGYEPHLGQKAIHESKARFKVAVAGRRWGKSLSASKEAEVMLLTPKTRGWIVSKTYDLGEKVFRQIFDTLIIGFELETVRKSYSVKSGSMYLEFPWGSVVDVKSAEHPDSLVGEGLDWLIFDECAKCKGVVWEQYLRPTLTDKNGWALFITTPEGMNWVHDLWQRGQDPAYPEWASFKSPSWTNPYLPAEDIYEARNTLSEEIFKQEFGADFANPRGRVYKQFSEEIHVIPKGELYIDPQWLKFRSFDFGYTNPFVCLYIAVDPSDNVYVYDEYVKSGLTIHHHASKLTEDETDYEWNSCDPSGANERATLAEMGMPTICTNSTIQEGLELIRQKLKIKSDEKPSLYVSSSCKNTIFEFNSYCYPEGNDDEEPFKRNDHCMDALRYFMVNWKRGYIRQSSAKYL